MLRHGRWPCLVKAPAQVARHAGWWLLLLLGQRLEGLLQRVAWRYLLLLLLLLLATTGKWQIAAVATVSRTAWRTRQEAPVWHLPARRRHLCRPLPPRPRPAPPISHVAHLRRRLW